MAMRIALSALVFLLGGLLLVACGDDSEGGNSGSNQTTPSQAVAGAAAVEMSMQDFKFEPDKLSAQPGAEFTVHLKNEGQSPHTFTISGLDVDSVLQPGATSSVTFTPDKDGMLTFFCRFHQAQGMQGVMTVGSGGGQTAGSAGGAAPGY